VYRVSCIVYCLLFKARFESDVLVGFEISKIRISKKQTAADIGDMAETSVSQYGKNAHKTFFFRREPSSE
jgi:hypothetical protein